MRVAGYLQIPVGNRVPVTGVLRGAGPFRGYASPIHHADGRRLALNRFRSGRSTRKGIRYRIKRYRDRRWFCSYPPERHPVQDVRGTGLHSGEGTGAVRLSA